MKHFSIEALLYEIWVFGWKQAYAAMFGGAMLAVIVFTKYLNLGYVHRYDFIFLFAVLFQLVLIFLKLERKEEVLMIAVFHILATCMELFKTSNTIGAWRYPEPAFFMLLNVPLFAGFMYSAVGSYIARCWRIFDFYFTKYPPFYLTAVLAGFSYANFITHHFVFDIRWGLFLFSFIIFWKTRINFKILKKHRSMPLVLGFALVTVFIFLAENISTFTSVWLYPSQYSAWHPVSFAKLGSWYLLMIVSFVLISSINRNSLRN